MAPSEKAIKKFSNITSLTSATASGISNVASSMAAGEQAAKAFGESMMGVGSALVAFNPPLGAAIVAVGALTTVVSSLTQAEQLNADGLNKHDASLVNHRNLLLQVLDTKKNGIGISDTAKKLLDEDLKAANLKIESEKQQVVHAMANIAVRGKLIEKIKEEMFAVSGNAEQAKALAAVGAPAFTASSKQISLLMTKSVLDKKQAADMKLVASQQGILNVQTKVANDLSAKKVSAQSAESKLEAAKFDSLKKLLDLQSQLNKSKAPDADKKAVQDQIKSLGLLDKAYKDAAKNLSTNQLKLIKQEQLFATTTKKSEQEIIKAKIDGLKKQIEIGKKLEENNKEIEQNDAQSIQSRASMFGNYTQQMADTLVESGGDMVEMGKKFGAMLIQDTANIFAGELELAAAKHIFLNPGLAIAELAGALAIRAAGGALAGALGGGGGSTGGSPAITPQNTDTGSSDTPDTTNNTNTTNSQSSNITINVQGNMPNDRRYIQELARQLSEAVQSSNVTLVASGTTGSF